MSMRSKVKTMTMLCVALLALQPAPVLAQGPSADKYFPEGTDMVVQVNLSQLMGSQLLHKGIPLVVGKYGETVLNMVIPFVPEDNKKMLEGIAPTLKDKVTEESVTAIMTAIKGEVREFTVAINTRDEVNNVPQVVMTLGIPRLKNEMVEQGIGFARLSGQVDVKEDKVGGVTVYEMKPNNSPLPFFVTVPEDGIMVISISKEIIASTLKNKGNAKIDPKFKELLSQRKNTYSLFVAGLAPKKQEDEIKNYVITMTMDKNITGNVNVACTDADKAKEKAKEANEHFEQAVASIVQFADDHPELKPLSESFKKVKAEVNGATISMKLNVSGDELIKALKDAK